MTDFELDLCHCQSTIWQNASSHIKYLLLRLPSASSERGGAHRNIMKCHLSHISGCNTHQASAEFLPSHHIIVVVQNWVNIAWWEVGLRRYDDTQTTMKQDWKFAKHENCQYCNHTQHEKKAASSIFYGSRILNRCCNDIAFYMWLNIEYLVLFILVLKNWSFWPEA